MGKSKRTTGIQPDLSDFVLAQDYSSLKKVLPNHNLNIKASFVKRKNLKNVDLYQRTHYLKLDCKIENAAGKIVQEFNRFILLDLEITHL